MEKVIFIMLIACILSFLVGFKICSLYNELNEIKQYFENNEIKEENNKSILEVIKTHREKKIVSEEDEKSNDFFN